MGISFSGCLCGTTTCEATLKHREPIDLVSGISEEQ